MIPAAFEYHAPRSLREALALVRDNPDETKVIAGGQSLIPMMKLRLANPARLVDLRLVPGLSNVVEGPDALMIGPTVTYRALETSEAVQRRLPLLAEAASAVGDLQVRNRGTLGGSVAHADPAGDMPAVMLAAEARIETVGGPRRRSIAADRFFVDAYTTALRPTELISGVRIPYPPARSGGAYRKLANQASHFAVVGVAALVTIGSDGRCDRARIGITGAGPVAVRAKAAERFLHGKEPTPANVEAAAARAWRGIECIGDIYGSPEYREHLTGPLTYDALTEAIVRATG